MSTGKGRHDENLFRRAEEVLRTRINPILRKDNGYAVLISVQGGVATVRLEGSCVNCPYAQNTFRTVISDTLLKEVPGVRSVRLDESVDDDFLRIARQFLSHPEEKGGRTV